MWGASQRVRAEGWFPGRVGGRNDSEEVGSFPESRKGEQVGAVCLRVGPLLETERSRPDGAEGLGRGLWEGSWDARTGVGNFGMCPTEPMQMRPVCMQMRPSVCR